MNKKLRILITVGILIIVVGATVAMRIFSKNDGEETEKAIVNLPTLYEFGAGT